MSSRFVRWCFAALALALAATGCANRTSPPVPTASVQPCPVTPDCPCQHGRAPTRVAAR